jgi:hypothetical protein
LRLRASTLRSIPVGTSKANKAPIEQVKHQ